MIMCAHPTARTSCRGTGRSATCRPLPLHTPARPHHLLCVHELGVARSELLGPRGYVVVNVDLRGFGTSEGVGRSSRTRKPRTTPRPSSGPPPAVVERQGRAQRRSYLAISQWAVAALRPKALAAICPWEGFTDVYREVAYPGGVREDGFIKFWATMTERAGRTTESLREQQLAHPEWDDFWAARTPALERIEVPALICASFSDQGLHSRGSFEAFRRIGSDASVPLHASRRQVVDVLLAGSAGASGAVLRLLPQGRSERHARRAARSPRGSREPSRGALGSRRIGVAAREHALATASPRARRSARISSRTTRDGSARRAGRSR